jgi:hypothetical protein
MLNEEKHPGAGRGTPVPRFGHLYFDIGAYLEFGIWCLGFLVFGYSG